MALPPGTEKGAWWLAEALGKALLGAIVKKLFSRWFDKAKDSGILAEDYKKLAVELGEVRQQNKDFRAELNFINAALETCVNTKHLLLGFINTQGLSAPKSLPEPPVRKNFPRSR